MKYNLLQLVQAVASSMDSDEVNSITDSVESLQIATVVRTAYMDILARASLPEHFSFVNLTSSGDSTKPTLMTLPDTVEELLWLKYNKATLTAPTLNMQPVAFMPLDDFLSMLYQYDLTDTTTYGSFTHSLSGSTVTVPYRKDNAPQYYTTFDDNTLLFDSYDAAMDTTLQSSKTMAYCRLVIDWTMSDSFVPDLDDAQFALLLNEAKSLAWAELKQTQHTKAEVNAKRGWTRLQQTKERTEKKSSFDRAPNYGRK